MPIRFECQDCGQRLSIARRKAGTNIDCPTCGRSQPVPDERSNGGLREDAVEEESPGEEIEVEEDWVPFEVETATSDSPPIPDDVDLSETIDLTYPPELPQTVPTASPPPPPLPSKAGHDPKESALRIPIPWAIYAQALLLFIVAVGGFCAGYYLGRQDGSLTEVVPNKQVAAAPVEPDDGFADERVLLEGRILWTPNLGESAGDAGASFIALPKSRIPPSSLPIAGLQSGTEGGNEAQASIRAIRAAGGVFERAAKDGSFAAVFPREGIYYLLMISRNVLRPEGEPILARDLVYLKQYFADPERLIGASQYVWRADEIRVGHPVVEQDFGLDGL